MGELNVLVEEQQQRADPEDKYFCMVLLPNSARDDIIRCLFFVYVT